MGYYHGMRMAELSRKLLIVTVSTALVAAGLVTANPVYADEPNSPTVTDSSTIENTPTPDPAETPTLTEEPAAPATTPPSADASGDLTDDQLRAQGAAQEQYRSDNPENSLLDSQSSSSIAKSDAAPLAAAAFSFNPANLISDADFYNGNAADASSVQNFLNNMLSSCRSGYVCLKDYGTSTISRGGNLMCNAYNGSSWESAATIIYKVGAACGISQKALLVLLQKEQSLVTDDSPSTRQYAFATGYACPDTAECDTTYQGFYNQVYWAAYQFKRYGNPPGTSQFFTWFPVGGNSNIQFHPNASCGSSRVVIQNKATAALYYYTPYQPNASVLNGNPDDCAAFGNFNFSRLFNSWFPPAPPSIAPIGNLEAVQTSNGTITATGWAADATAAGSVSNVRIDLTSPTGATSSTTVAAGIYRADLGVNLPWIGAFHGFSWSTAISTSGSYRVCVTALVIPNNAASSASIGCQSRFYSATIGGTPSSNRIQGDTRYDVAVNVSKAAFPGNAKAPVVYIVTGDNYPDALSAAPAAVKEGGSLLLTQPDYLPPSVATEIKRLNPSRIVVVGGPSSVSEGVFASLGTLVNGASVTRIGGADRYIVSRAVATTVFSGGAAGAYIATGANFPDALGAGAAAGSKSQPVVLVNGGDSTLDTATATTLRTLGVKNITVVGGPDSLAPSIVTTLNSIAPTNRYSGSDRFDSVAAVNAAAFTQSNQVYLATGYNFPDALAGSVLAGLQKAPLYVVRGDCVPDSVAKEIARLKATKVTLLGGQSALTVAVDQLARC